MPPRDSEIATMLALGLGSAAVLAQGPAGTSDAMIGKVLDIQGRVLDIVGLGADTQGPSSRITGQVVSLGAAIQDLKGAGSGWWSRKRRNHPLLGPKPRRGKRSRSTFQPMCCSISTRPTCGPRLLRCWNGSRVCSGPTRRHRPPSRGTRTVRAAISTQPLSERRAQSVRLWLIGRGVSNSLTARGFGKTRPIAANTLPNGADNPDGRQKNRRVEITFTTAQ